MDPKIDSTDRLDGFEGLIDILHFDDRICIHSLSG